MTRLDAVAATTDGFELARLDLSQRREGDILGAAQHGRRTQLEFLHILEDEDVIEQAREDAFALVADDPELGRAPRPRRGRARPGRRRAGRLPGAWLMTRVIAGTAGGRTLRTPPGSGTRPTSDRVREAVFSALDARDAVRGSRVLDLYAGSGALGLEAAVAWRRLRRARRVRPPGGRRHRRQRARPRAHRHPRRSGHRRGPPRPRPVAGRRRTWCSSTRRTTSTRPPSAPCSTACVPAGSPRRPPRRRALHPQPRARLARRHPAGHQAQEVRRDHDLVRHPRLNERWRSQHDPESSPAAARRATARQRRVRPHLPGSDRPGGPRSPSPTGSNAGSAPGPVTRHRGRCCSG